jgi:broad specificity phosphatase PhoE
VGGQHHYLASRYRRENVGVISTTGISSSGDKGVKIMTSTMPRAVDTALGNEHFKVEQYSNLNPLDKGDFSGMEMDDIEESDPDWYAMLKEDPYSTRFPGGESYEDLVQRLESSVVDMEQQVRFGVASEAC